MQGSRVPAAQMCLRPRALPLFWPLASACASAPPMACSGLDWVLAAWALVVEGALIVCVVCTVGAACT